MHFGSGGCGVRQEVVLSICCEPHILKDDTVTFMLDTYRDLGDGQHHGMKGGPGHLDSIETFFSYF